MLFADVEELLQFELLDLKKAFLIGGKDYLEKEENKIISRLCSYSNAFITLDLATFFREKNNTLLKEHALTVYIEFSKQNYLKLLKKEKTGDNFELDAKLFEDRNKLLKKHSDISIFCENTNKKDIIKQLLLAINEYYIKKGK